jgi:hypothetical protein
MINKLLMLAALSTASLLSQQGGALVFVKGGDAWIMGTDGSHQTRLTNFGDVSMPRLANNVLVFIRGNQLQRTTMQGYALSAPAQVIPNTAGVLEFDLSPDGSRIVLTYYANNNTSLYTMNTDGTALTAINTTGQHQALMSWGRDGFIYFVQSGIGNALSQTLYRIPENGMNNATQLTGYFSQFPAAGGIGNKVAFVYDHPSKHLRTMNADGSNQADIPGVNLGDGGYIGIDWFSDFIYYAFYDQIWRVRFDGSANQVLTTGAFPGYVDYGTLNLDTTPPVVTSVTATPNPVSRGAAITLSGTFTDAGGSGLALAQYTIDGSAAQMMATISGSAASASIGIAPFPSAGIHNLCIRAQDMAGNVGQYRCTLLAVYDPDGGFVIGGGWINSSLGRANFGLVAKYLWYASVPQGIVEFHVGNLKFRSSTLGWLVVSGDVAVLSGTGEINGTGGYQFQLTAKDLNGGDQLGIKIWNSSAVVFDTAPVPLGGGQIVIH